MFINPYAIVALQMVLLKIFFHLQVVMWYNMAVEKSGVPILLHTGYCSAVIYLQPTVFSSFLQEIALLSDSTLPSCYIRPGDIPQFTFN